MILIPYLVAFVLFSFLPTAFAQTADCDQASGACRASCAKLPIYDRESQGYVQGSDFQIQCEHSCLSGADFCRLQDSRLGCATFNSYCVAACPWIVTDTANNSNISSSDSFYQCLRACDSGYKGCGAILSTVPPRPRTGSFDVCTEAQGGCYSACMGAAASAYASASGGMPADFPAKCAHACADGVPDCQSAADQYKYQSFIYACGRSCPDVKMDDARNVSPVSYNGEVCMGSCQLGGQYGAALLK